MPENAGKFTPCFLCQAAELTPTKLHGHHSLSLCDSIRADEPLLVLLAAGKGTRFGDYPKCATTVSGKPLARYSINAFRRISPQPAVVLVGYKHEEVARALGPDNIYVRTANATGGTAFAAWEALSVPGLLEKNPLLVITMGDRIVPSSLFQRLLDLHGADGEANLTFLTALYKPPKNHGKGRILRDSDGRVQRIIEQRDIDAQPDASRRKQLDTLSEGNCPLYVLRARTLERHLRMLTNDNAQQQFYITDIVSRIADAGGVIRTLMTEQGDADYELLTSDVTRPADVPPLESVLARNNDAAEIEAAAHRIARDRPRAQTASISRQVEELWRHCIKSSIRFDADQPVAIGLSGGRLRIAFMHPDMRRFFGPAWQMPIGAGTADGDEQILILMQAAADGLIRYDSTDAVFREAVGAIPADDATMFPDDSISDWHSYERFGTQMSEKLLLALGYLSDEQAAQMKQSGIAAPVEQLVSTNMRRPFSLIANALASMRTCRVGAAGVKVEKALGMGAFGGLRLASTGHVPQGGFSSSSAVTVAVLNALNLLFQIDVDDDTLVNLACQAEYGTGVRAGALDQATLQKGRAGHGVLISSNPKEAYRVLGYFPAPSDRFKILFPNSVDRDREAWKWSWGFYGADYNAPQLTTGEMRKLTGKAAEIAAILLQLPLEQDFFSGIRDDLLQNGFLSDDSHAWVRDTLANLPLLISRDALQKALVEKKDWLAEQIVGLEKLSPASARRRAEETIAGLFSGWREPLFYRQVDGQRIQEHGVPLRAMLAYLFAEMAKNVYLLHHQEEWIHWVTASQRGDRCFDIDSSRLPQSNELMRTASWEAQFSGPELLNHWLQRAGAVPFDYNAGLSDEQLKSKPAPPIHELAGSNFFRGLALIDFAEAILKRAFTQDAVAVRINAAGQGDFFQVHVDTRIVTVREVKEFIRYAFYRRFGLTPAQDFVELHPGGGALGLRLSRFDLLPQLASRLAILSKEKA